MCACVEVGALALADGMKSKDSNLEAVIVTV